MAKTTAKKPTTTKANSDTLIVAEESGKSREQKIAEIGLSSVMFNAQTSRLFAKPTFGELDLNASIDVLCDEVKRVQDGSLKGLEATLVAQAAALDKIFGELARRAAANMGEYMDATDKYMRLALKAQSQCRATIQTLGELKNPPVVYARQANITSGPQQVNNGTAPAHAGKNQNQPNELLVPQATEHVMLQS